MARKSKPKKSDGLTPPEETEEVLKPLVEPVPDRIREDHYIHSFDCAHTRDHLTDVEHLRQATAPRASPSAI